MNITNRGHVDSVAAAIGVASGASGIVTISGGSVWDISGDLIVGGSGSGTLDIMSQNILMLKTSISAANLAASAKST